MTNYVEVKYPSSILAKAEVINMKMKMRKHLWVHLASKRKEGWLRDIYLVRFLTLFHTGGADSAPFQIVFFITSVRHAAEPRNLVTFPKI